MNNLNINIIHFYEQWHDLKWAFKWTEFRISIKGTVHKILTHNVQVMGPKILLK